MLAALGSTLSNKYAEGYPGRRYYGGCEVVDRAEEIGIARGKELFGAEHANLQPHSGASANLAAYGAFMQPGDTLLGMALPHGGHLTHGTKVSASPASGSTPCSTASAEKTEHIDYDQVRDLAREHRPKMIVCGGSAIPRLIDFAAFREIADEVGAILMVDAAHFIGLVAGKAIPSPVPYADVVTFTTHKVLRGPRGGAIVCKAEHAKAIDKAVVPDDAGRPAHARGRGQGGEPQGVPAAGVPGLRAAGHRQRPGAHRGPGRRGPAPGRRRHRHPPRPARPAGDRGHRQGRRGALRRRRASC